MADNKRRREDDEPYGGRPAKRLDVRVEEFLERMDPSVRIKLRSMFDDGMLMMSDLDEKNIQDLSSFDASTALETLEHYCSGDLSKVRSRRAYLAGAIRRRQSLLSARQHDIPLSVDGPVLCPEVQHALDRITQRCPKAGELDQRSMDALATLPPSRALAALDRYGIKEFDAVRNPSALFMAMVRQVMDAEHDGGGGGWGGGGPDDRDGGPRGWGGPGGGGPYRDGGGPGPFYRGGDFGPDPYYHERERDRGGYERDDYDPYDPFGGPPPLPRHQPPPPPPPPRRGVGVVPLAGGPPSGGVVGVGTTFAQLAGALAAGLPPGTTLAPGPDGTFTVVSAGAAAAAAAPVISTAAGVGGLGGLGAGAVAGGGLMLAPQQQAQQAPGSVIPQLMVLNPSSVGAAGAGGAPVLQQQQQQGVVGGLGIPAVEAAAAPAGVLSDWAAGRTHYGTEQGQLGVRIAEFHELSPFAVYVHPSPALKLQSLWDAGNELVSMFDDKVWQVLAELPAPEALAAIQEAADALDNPDVHIRNVNAFFLSCVRKVWPHGGARAAGGGRGDHHHNQHGGGGYGSRGDGGYGGGGGAAAAGGSGRSTSGIPRRIAPGAIGGGGLPKFSREPAMHLLPPELRGLAEELCKAHAPLLRPEHFDEGVIDSLTRLSPELALCVLNELGENDMTGVRNMPAYIMGIGKRYAAGIYNKQQPRGGGGGAGGAPPHVVH